MDILSTPLKRKKVARENKNAAFGCRENQKKFLGRIPGSRFAGSSFDQNRASETKNTARCVLIEGKRNKYLKPTVVRPK